MDNKEKQTLVFASRNLGKLKEVKAILGDDYKVLSLDDIGFKDEIPEPHSTIRENAIHKAEYFYKITKTTCIAEDSGLEVEILGNKPSAFSARYAGNERDDIKNYTKILDELKGKVNRNAQFLSVLVFKNDKTTQVFEGTMKGTIAIEPKGVYGFGYDPIFIANGNTETNAEISQEEKNKISHRRKSLDQFNDFLKN